MNEIILAYGLGIVSVGLILLTRVVLKADKKVSEQERWRLDFQHEYQQNLSGVYRHIADVERQFESANHRNFENVHRKIDSRIDKLEFKITDQLNYIKSKTSQAY